MTVELSKQRRGKAHRISRFRDTFSKWTFILPAALLLGAVLVYPLLYTLRISFSTFDLASFSPTGWVGFENYSAAFENESWRMAAPRCRS